MWSNREKWKRCKGREDAIACCLASFTAVGLVFCPREALCVLRATCTVCVEIRRRVVGCLNFFRPLVNLFCGAHWTFSVTLLNGENFK